MTWERTGGGCRLINGGGYPCDDDYENQMGDRIRFYSTKEAHFAMPHEVQALIEIRDLDGVEAQVLIMGNKPITGIERAGKIV